MRGQTDRGKSQISQTETAGRSSSKTAGTIRRERGDLGNRRWKEQWPEKRRGGDGGTGDGGGDLGDRRWRRERGHTERLRNLIKAPEVKSLQLNVGFFFMHFNQKRNCFQPISPSYLTICVGLEPIPV